MFTRHTVLAGFVVALAALVLVAPALAQDPTAQVPTAKDPLRFTAFGVSMQAGAAGVIDIAIERWTADDERTMLLNTLAQKGQAKVIDALQDIKVRTGYIRTPNSLGYDLRYCRENTLPDGTRQIVIVTDKPVSFLAAVSGSRTLDYPFTLIEMRFPKGSVKGEGKMLAQTAMGMKDGRLELENYSQEPVRLTSITQEKDKKK